MALLSKKQPTCSTGCMIGKWIVAILLLIVSLASLVGVYQTHVVMGAGSTMALQFGSTSGSLSIIAFAISTSVLVKKLASCMNGSCDICCK